ncbi:MAG: DUF4007 family protein [Deltaproteobacteria bacterium]|nr:DUF4007 family protein [Pseudomonadota bacterium]MCK4604550.1 DUF4007 family protein [Deltaproteobacteria bacterium]
MAEKGKTGHRQRLRDRFLAGEEASRSDERLLELLLTFAVGRKDVKPLALELIRVFGGLSQVLSASPDDLCKVKGIGQSSIALLKVVNFIQSGTVSVETNLSLPKGADANQLKFFEDPKDEPTPEPSFSDLRGKKSEGQKTPSVLTERSEKEGGAPNASSVAKTTQELQRPSRVSKKSSLDKKSIRRKFQVSNGYLLEFDQLARVLHFLLENRDARKINRKSLRENTGLADRQVASLISIGAAMGLIQPGCQILTPTGLLIAQHDIFIEKRSSLEWCHYAGAGTYRNLVWFEIFNHLLIEEPTMTQEGWNKYFRFRLDGQYSGKTIKDHVPKEVRFVIDAYLERNFSKLEILLLSSDSQLYRRRYTSFNRLVFSAMIYDFCTSRGAQLFQFGEMAVMPGSPAAVFGLDAASFRQQIEGLHDSGWLRYETTHNLDQIRLKPGFSAIEFLTAHFEDREPHQNDELGMMNDE